MRSVVLLLVGFVTLGATCRTAPPRQELCLINFPGGYADCYDSYSTGDGTKKSLSELDKYIARSSEDEQYLEEWIKRECMGAEAKDYQLPIDRILRK